MYSHMFCVVWAMRCVIIVFPWTCPVIQRTHEWLPRKACFEASFSRKEVEVYIWATTPRSSRFIKEDSSDQIPKPSGFLLYASLCLFVEAGNTCVVIIIICRLVLDIIFKWMQLVGNGSLLHVWVEMVCLGYETKLLLVWVLVSISGLDGELILYSQRLLGKSKISMYLVFSKQTLCPSVFGHNA